MAALIIWLSAIPYDFVKHDMASTSSGLGSPVIRLKTF